VKITLKLYASLGQYLPAGAVKNEAGLDVADGTTAADVLRAYNVPEGMCHLVLINGSFVPPGARDTAALQDGDALAVWPPVAGG
jgi:sulfur carrier protein ThiS